MDADTIRILSGAVLIAIGVPVIALSRYFLAREANKRRSAQALKIMGTIWVAVGVILYLAVLLTHVI
ncbi:MAG TPA: hypothetical protein VMB24_06605 [Dehalococcoidales bacterium]|nr:hypothetical protein [Dehalococcoidales bacterium]